jgi:ArsR family transcriptional regulator, arsenate/arsenite/antimonite-responsive transcriptional repressor
VTPRACPPSPSPDPHADPDEELARLTAALAHPARIRILRFLLEQEECFAGAIVEHLPLAQSTVSQHLKVLREAGLIRGEVDGLHICYCADRGRLRKIGELLKAISPVTAGTAP